MKKYLPVLMLFLLSISCEDYTQDDYKEYYVVESILQANESLPPVRLTTTVPINESYDYRNISNIKNAEIRIHLLSNENPERAEKVFNYQFNDNKYLSRQQHHVLPGRTYKLEIRLPEGSEPITAHTHVPEEIQIVHQSSDSISYKARNNLRLKLSGSFVNKDTLRFLINAFNKTPSKDKLTPFFKQFLEDKNNDIHEYNYINQHLWGMFEASEFPFDENNFMVIDYPWSEFPFYGNNIVLVNSIDGNLYDFLRSQMVQQETGRVSPGEIYNIITYVDGALGVFGSMTADTAHVYLKE